MEYAILTANKPSDLADKVNAQMSLTDSTGKSYGWKPLGGCISNITRTDNEVRNGVINYSNNAIRYCQTMIKES